MNRLVIWFSCGAASAVAAKLAITENAGKLPVVVVRCYLAEEHEDNERFAADCERWFGVPITTIRSEEYPDGSIFSVFEKRRFISNMHGAPCTKALKRLPREAYQRPDDLHVFGYTAEERARYDAFLDANNGIRDWPILIERGLLKEECLAMVERAGIVLPVMYGLGFEHNNCIGCVKATGAGYWNAVRTHFPIRFDRMARFSRGLGARLVLVSGERMFLDELPEGVGNMKTEPVIRCGFTCELAEQTYRDVRHVQGKLQP